MSDEVVSLPWRDGLPPFNRLVLAWMEGVKEHSEMMWKRSGFAFMVRHNDPEFTMADGWSRNHYERALTDMGADAANVVRWIPLEAPRV